MFTIINAQSNSPAGNSSLPTVDLGYEVYQASSFNQTGGFYNFSNIRYAAPPLGNLRFAAPQSPAVNRTHIQTGAVGRICPQISPGWESIATEYLTDLLYGATFNASQTPRINASNIPPIDPRTTEDCLFLDVYVPQQILESAGMGYGAPVLVWIFGGGYTAGDKAAFNPAGLLAASGNVSNGEVVYVAINYRLGAFGFLSGPTMQADGGVANAAFLDQRMALEWVQDNIHLFGGDRNKVTVFGESAGGGSIMHQITAYGGSQGPAPFQQAILQSPGWLPTTSNYVQEQTFNRFLNLTNTTSLAELRNAPSDVLIKANALQVFLDASYGTFIYGPVVDGDFAPALPGQLLAQGRFDKSVRVMVGHNANEGAFFADPYVQNETAYEDYIRTDFPSISEDVLAYMTQTLYPPVFDGTYGYTSHFERIALATAEGIFTCNTFYLDRAFGNKTYAYLFAVPPAFHSFDVAYTFYIGDGPSAFLPNTTVAVALQDYITSFAKFGRPSAKGMRMFNLYGPDAAILDLNQTSITQIMDPTANGRCDWWQKALYF